MIQVPAEYETQDLFRGKSRFLDKPGAYHAQVVASKEMVDENYVELSFEIIGPAENGKRIDTRIYTRDTAGMPQYAPLIGVAIQLGLLTIEQYEDARAKRQNVNLDFDSAPGRQAIIDVVASKYTDRKTGEERPCVRLWPDGIKHLDDPNYAKVPLNAELAAFAGSRRGNDPFMNPQGQPQQHTQMHPTNTVMQPAASTSSPTYDDI